MFEKLKKIPTTKKLMFFLFVNCTLIELFTGWVTIQNLILVREVGTVLDFTPLVTMIGAILGAAIDVAAYFAKSAKENTKGGIIYEAALNDKTTVG